MTDKTTIKFGSWPVKILDVNFLGAGLIDFRVRLDCDNKEAVAAVMKLLEHDGGTPQPAVLVVIPERNRGGESNR